MLKEYCDFCEEELFERGDDSCKFPINTKYEKLMLCKNCFWKIHKAMKIIKKDGKRKASVKTT
ncbi:unnamed protein product [marine sediment metagenome]|uniref:Uncharacterized protein n=1 Tax=marine sediment metagenome TaxID=412755 RepID=X0X7W8_9ZZZZ